MALEILIDGIDYISYLVDGSLTVEQRADSFVSTCSLQLSDPPPIKVKDPIVIQHGATKYFAGIIANIDTENMAQGPEALLHTLECQDYNLLVEEVVIDQLEEYGGAKDSDIIDDLFDKYLPEVNSHGPGDVPAGYVQHLHVFAEISFEAITLREALDHIASEVESTALEGFWYIDYDKYLHYFNVEDNAPAWYLSDTPDNVNSFSYLSAVRKSCQGAALANRILVVGAEMALFVQDQDSHDYYGKWFEAIVRDNTLLSVDEVVDYGNALLTKWAYPEQVIEISTRKEGLRAGMNVRFENSLFDTAPRTNYSFNPSFEINVTDGWSYSGAGGSASADATRASVGSKSCKLVAANGVDAILSSWSAGVADGGLVAVQARLHRPTAISSKIIIWDSTNGQIRATATPISTGRWEVLSACWTNDTGNPANIMLCLYNEAADGASAVWFDACMIEVDKGPLPLEYIDGTLPYCYWLGPAHNSLSRRESVFTIKQLVITWPENTPTFALTLGGAVSPTALIRSRLAADNVRRGLGPVVAGQLPLSSTGWSHNLVFTASDHDTVAWGAGTITSAAGNTYSIVAGNTGNMAATTYIYLDTDTSLTVLQTAVTPAVGKNIILVAWAKPQAVGLEATFIVFGGAGQGVLVDTANIADGAVDTAQMADLAVELAKIADGAVDTDKMADLAVELAKIADGAVDTDKIAVNAVTAGKIFAGAVTTAKIAAGAVETDKLAANAVTAAKIFANTITATEIDAGAITTDELAANAVTSVKILARTIEAGDIKINTITATEIAAGEITTNEIAANTILAGNINAGAIETDKLAAEAVTAGKIAANTITAAQIEAGTITTTEIAADTITAGNIVAGTITTTEIAADTILAGNITAGAIETDKLAAGAVTTGKLAAQAVIATKIDIGGFGDLLFTNETGLLLLNPHCKITPTSWLDTRGKKATIAGAFHQEPGPWVNSRGLVVEPATTNYELAPRMKDANSDGLADGWTYWDNLGSGGSATLTVVAHPIAERGWMQRLQYTAVAGDVNDTVVMYDRTQAASFAAGQNCTLSYDIYGSATGVIVRLHISMQISAEDAGNNPIEGLWSDPITVTQAMQRVQLTFANLPANTDHVLAYLYISSVDDGDTLDVYFGAVNVEKTTFATSPCIGSLDWCAWSGAEDDSTSTRTTTTINLDAHAGLISNQDQLTFSVWVQAPYDHDATWPTGTCWIFGTRGANDNSRILLRHNNGTDQFELYVNGAYRIQTAGITFEAGDWLCLDVTVNFTDNVCKLYINGEQVGISGVSHTAAPVLTTWKLGSSWEGTYQSGWCIGEYAVLNTVWPAEEVAAQYALHRPLVDAGATEKPGLYILDGRVKIASSTTGNRIEITADEIAGYDGGGTKQFYLRASDGAGCWAGGVGKLTSDGLTIIASTANLNSIRWVFGSSTVCRVIGYRLTGSNWMESRAIAPSATQQGVINIRTESSLGVGTFIQVLSGKTGVEGNIIIYADDVLMLKITPNTVAVSGSTKFTTNAAIEAGSYIEAQGDIRTVGGIRAGSTGAVDDGDMWCSGYISTDGGVTKWELGGYAAGAPPADGYLNVWIGPQQYRVLVDKV